MMKTIRVVAIGMMVSAFLMTEFGQVFFSYWMRSESYHAWALVIQAMAPNVAASTGIGVVAVIAFALMCVGVGLLFSATIYGWIEDTVARAYKAYGMRNNESDYAHAFPPLLFGGNSGR
jgi:uncharacterized membrane protein YesL